MKLKFGRRAFIVAATAIGLAGPVTAGGHQVLESIHFLIPGGAGGGWDGSSTRAQARRSPKLVWLAPHPMKTCLVVAVVRPSVT